VKKTGGGVASRTRVGGWVDRGREKYYKGLEKYTGGLGRGVAMKGRAKLEKEKEEKMKKLEITFGDLKSIDLKVLEDKAGGKLGTAEDKALWLKAAAAQGKLGEKQKTAEKFMKEGGERELSKKDLSEITDKNLYLATTTRNAQKRIQSKNENEVPEELRDEFRNASNDRKEEMIREQIMREKIADLEKEGKAHYATQGLDDKLVAKAWMEGQTPEGMKNNIKRLTMKEQSALAEGLVKNIRQFKDGNLVDYEGKVIKKSSEIAPEDRKDVEEKNLKYSIASAKLGKKLEQVFAWGGSEIEEKIKEGLKEFSTQDIKKLKTDDIAKYGKYLSVTQLDALRKEADVERMMAAKESIVNEGKSHPLYDYVTKDSPFYSGLEKDKKDKG
jgi:hypothetical protein